MSIPAWIVRHGALRDALLDVLESDLSQAWPARELAVLVRRPRVEGDPTDAETLRVAEALAWAASERYACAGLHEGVVHYYAGTRRRERPESAEEAHAASGADAFVVHRFGKDSK